MDHNKPFCQRVNLVLVSPPYNVRKIRNDEHAAYNNFGVDNTNDMVLFYKYVINVIVTTMHFSRRSSLRRNTSGW